MDLARSILVSLGLVWLTACAPDPAPILLLIDVDTLRADALGIYGSDLPTSPFLDGLAEESVVFEWAFSQAPNTPPSQTSILTGLRPSRHGVRSAGDRASDRLVTLAEAFVAQGWQTAGFVDGGYMAPEFGLGQGFETYTSVPQLGLKELVPLALQWMDARDPTRPAFVFVHTYDVHGPYRAAEPHFSEFTAGVENITPGFEATADQLDFAKRRLFAEGSLGLSRGDLELARRRYLSAVRRLDDLLRDFFDKLDRRGVLDRTTVIVTSDHGEAFGEHGHLFHAQLYAEVTHVPLILRLPTQRSLRVGQVVELVDVVPTVLELHSVPWLEAGGEIDGRSLARLISGLTLRARPAFAETELLGGAFSVTGERHRLLRWQSPGARPSDELFEYRSDRRETRNLASELPDVVAALAELEGRRRRHPSGQPGRAKLEPETVKQLEALGYL